MLQLNSLEDDELSIAKNF